MFLGYRHLPLFDSQGEQFLFSTLFVKIQVDPIKDLDGPIAQPEATETTRNIRLGVDKLLGNRFSSSGRS